MSNGITFGSDDLDYTHTGFMQTLRDRKSGAYSPDINQNGSTKVNSSFRDLTLDLKDILGYSASAITDAALKNGIRRIEYYHPDDDSIELYKLAKKVNIILAQCYKDRMVFGGNTDAHYMYNYALAQLSVAHHTYISYMNTKIRLDNERATVRYINDDTISGYYSHFRHLNITNISMLNIALVVGYTSDFKVNEGDWAKVDSMIPDQYIKIGIVFTDSVYNAYLNLMNDDIFKQYDD